MCRKINLIPCKLLMEKTTCILSCVRPFCCIALCCFNALINIIHNFRQYTRLSLKILFTHMWILVHLFSFYCSFHEICKSNGMNAHLVSLIIANTSFVLRKSCKGWLFLFQLKVTYINILTIQIDNKNDWYYNTL